MVIKKKKPLKIITAIISLCLLFTAIVPTSNAYASGSLYSSCAGPAGLLKWLICPAIDGLTGTLEDLYGLAKAQLTVPRTVLTQSSLSKAWGVSRDLANIIFVILFLVVIFSQVSGIGIDNYGIKKILPRLITCAILINLSFIICEVLIDISNIVGGTIDSWLEDLASEMNLASNQASIPAGAYFVNLGALIIRPDIAITVGLGFYIALIIALFHGIGAAITLFFVAIVRKISIILIVAVSPLAFAAYLLPNTEKLFKKWADWLKSILIIYPICSILVGGGALAGSVLNSGLNGSGTDNGVEVLAAMVAPLLPLWFLPKFLKGSLASLGAIGRTVAGWREKRGLTRKRRAKKALALAKSSQAYKSAVNTAKMKAMRSKVGSRIGSSLDKMSRTSGGGKRNALIRGIGMVGQGSFRNTLNRASQEEVNMYSSRNADESDKSVLSNEAVEAIKANNPERFAAAFRSLLSKGGKEEALRLIYDNPGDISKSPEMQKMVEREMGNSGMSFMRDYRKYQANGGTDNFHDFVANGALAAQLNARGKTALAGLDKDEYAFLAHAANANPSAFKDSTGASILTPEMLARGAASLSSSDQAAKYNQFLHGLRLQNSEQQAVVNKLSYVDTATMFDSTRIELSSAVPGKTNDVDRVKDRFNVQFSDMRANPDRYANALSQMPTDERTLYIS